jgi:diguanylate cyclase (GGDEF)-like protein
VTACLFVVTLIVTWQVGRLIAARQSVEFDSEVARVESRMRERAADYAQVLRSAVAFLEASPEPPNDIWARYVAALDLPGHLPGFESLDVVDADAVGDRDSAWREAMLRAGHTGTVALSARLFDEGHFVAVAPLRRDGQTIGWVTATLAADPFTRTLMETASPLELEVYDGERAMAGSLLLTAGLQDRPRLWLGGRDAFAREAPVDVLGRPWLVRYRAPERFISLSDRVVPWLAFVGGILATWLFHLTARSAALVRQQATHDALTGLANRTLFMKHVQATAEASKRGGRNFALVFIDIDGFKAVNDRHGHHAGDQLLKAIAGRLKHGMRQDDLLSRLGGDEFAAILAGGSDVQIDAAHYGQRVVDQISKPFTLALPDGDVRVSVGASVGVAVHPRHGEAWDALLVAADEAMYRAKRAGKGRCVLADLGEVLG